MRLMDLGNGTIRADLNAREYETFKRLPGRLEAYLTSWLESWGTELFLEEASLMRQRYEALPAESQRAVDALMTGALPPTGGRV